MKGIKPIFFTSDWHVGHANVIQFDNRPFRNVDHMSEYLVTQYKSTVPKNGVCYFLGDMGFGGNDILKKVLDQLHGTKVCIRGNHDKGCNSLYTSGFDVVLYAAQLEIAGYKLTLSHYPLLGLFREDVSGMKGAMDGENWHGETKHAKRAIRDSGHFHLHGHTHKKPEERTLLRQFDVGVRANNYRPVNISVIESWISNYERKVK